MSPIQIKALRESLGMTQTQLAEVCGVSRQAVYQWEAGTRNPSKGSVMLMRAAENSYKREG